MAKMIVKDGIQYRPEDAERLGIEGGDTIEIESKIGRVIRAGDPENKAVLTTATAKPTAKERSSAEKAAKEAQAAQDAAANGGTA